MTGGLIMEDRGRRTDELRRIRHDRLQNAYKIIADLYRHEDERLTDLVNIMALLQTIILAGFLQLSLIDPGMLARDEMLQLLKFVLPFIGIFLCITALYSFHRRIEAMQYWIASAGRVEKDEDFWLSYDEARDADLDLFTARQRHLKKHKSKYPGPIAWILKYQRYYLPLLFLSQWVLVACYLLLVRS
jgi:hypothetical protein